MVRRRLARAIFRLTGWRMVGEVPPTGVFVGAPHTSNWDFVIAVLVLWHGGVSPAILVKKEFFHGPVGWLLRLTGGIPVDRHNPSGVVDELVAQARSGRPFLVAIAAEGSRSRGEHWKSGFYRIARQTGLPIVLGFVDGATRTAGIGPTVEATGDVRADMDRIREFYADKGGLHPEQKTPVRLRDEGDEGDEGN
jgi:1-acyl-sn-glycerol-3-phosphate acyltransferase